MTAGLLGCIETPKQGNKSVPGVIWCADNGCYGKGFPGEAAWFAWLTRRADRASTCSFAVAPDVVGDAAATLDRSLPWLADMRALGFPVAFVAQNSIEHYPPPWDEIDVIFLGGSAECVHCAYVRPADDHDTKHCPGCSRRLREWKLGQVARNLTADALRRGKRVHMGRVNSLKRIRAARFMGCESADGTYIKKGPDENLPKALGWLKTLAAESESTLFGGVA